MTERGNRVAQRFEQQVEYVVELISGLSEHDLRVPCGDPRGHTVGGVVAHLRDGTGQVMRWADTMTPGVSVTAAPAAVPHAHEHSRGHGHGHGHEDGAGAVLTAAERDQVMAALAAGCGALARAVRGLSDEQLDSLPPPAPDLTDGTVPLHKIIDLITDDLASHMRHVEQALAAQPAAGQEAR